MKKFIAIVGLVLLCASAATYGKDRLYKVVIADPYIEMHTGPGRGYPIFHVADRGETVEIHKRHTDWFRVSTERGQTGWVRADQMARTLNTDGTPTEIENPTRDDFFERRWEAGTQIGNTEETQ